MVNASRKVKCDLLPALSTSAGLSGNVRLVDVIKPTVIKEFDENQLDDPVTECPEWTCFHIGSHRDYPH